MDQTERPPSALRIGVAILNYNGCALLLRTLASLNQSTRAPDAVCVVDNASTDDSVAAVRAAFPDVHVLALPRNLGGPGINAGFEWLAGQGCTVLWKLDNDVEMDSRCIEFMERAARRQPRAMLSPIIHYATPPDKVWFAGGFLDWTKMESGLHFETVEPFRELPQKDRFISGCAMWIPIEIYRAIGGYDPQLFLYLDDTDYSLRAGRAGFVLDVVPEARLVHLISASTGGVGTHSPLRLYYTVRSALLFWRKHLGFWTFHRRWCRDQLWRWTNHPPAWAADERNRLLAEALADAIWFFLSGQKEPTSRPRSPGWFRRILWRHGWVVAELMAFDLRALFGRSHRAGV